MALFSKKSAPTVDAAKEKKTKKVAKKVVTAPVGDTSWVIHKPRITEKAALLGDKNIYVFEVARRATKTDVKNAVVAQFKVTPVRVNIVNKMHRTTKSRARNRTLTVGGLRKAHVYLKKGDTINLI